MDSTSFQHICLLIFYNPSGNCQKALSNLSLGWESELCSPLGECRTAELGCPKGPPDPRAQTPPPTPHPPSPTPDVYIDTVLLLAHMHVKLHPHECDACFCWGCLLDPYGPSICQFNSSYMWVTHHHLPDYSVCSISHLLWWSLPLPKWMSFQKISKIGASLKFSNNASILVEMYGAVHRHKGRHHRRCLRL